MISLQVALLLMVALVGCSTNAADIRTIQIRYPYELSSSERAECKKMFNDFRTIDSHLHYGGSVHENEAPEFSFLAARQLPGNSWFGKQPALSLFLSIQATGQSCDLRSVKILAKSKTIVDLDMSISLGRISKLVDIYIQRHAENCRGIYKQKFYELLERMKQKDAAALERVETAFKTVKHDDLVQAGDSSPIDYDYYGLPESAKIVGLGYYVLGHQAARSIANQLLTLMSQNERLDFFKSRSKSGDKTSMAVLKKYLIEPCKKYLRHFESVLIPARFAAAHQDYAQLAWLIGNLEFTTAMANQLICRNLIDNPTETNARLITVMKELEQ